MSRSLWNQLEKRRGYALLSFVAHLTREQALAALDWNDRGNGCWTDEQARAEGCDPLTTLQAHTALLCASALDDDRGLTSPAFRGQL